MNPHPCGGGFLRDPTPCEWDLGPLSVRVTTKGGIRYSPFSYLIRSTIICICGDFYLYLLYY